MFLFPARLSLRPSFFFICLFNLLREFSLLLHVVKLLLLVRSFIFGLFLALLHRQIGFLLLLCGDEFSELFEKVRRGRLFEYIDS